MSSLDTVPACVITVIDSTCEAYLQLLIRKHAGVGAGVGRGTVGTVPLTGRWLDSQTGRRPGVFQGMPWGRVLARSPASPIRVRLSSFLFTEP